MDKLKTHNEMLGKELRILIIVDNFLIGGRETYVKNYLSALGKKLPIHLSLLTGRVDEHALEGIFGDVLSLDGDPNEVNLATWVSNGNDVIKRFKPDVIWGHHFKLLPAWLLSQHHGIPLLCTFHGSLFDQGQIIDEQDQLGLACVLKYKAVVSSVSLEIDRQIKALTNKQTHVFVNAINLTDNKLPHVKPPERKPPLQFLLLTRQQKLGHIRAAVKVFYRLKKAFPDARLLIHCGKNYGDDKCFDSQSFLFTLLGRKWLLLNPLILTIMNSITVKPLTTNVTKVIGQSDVVLGMGRVIVEAIALHKHAILVGYDEVVGVVDDTNVVAYQASNFSGRGQTPQAYNHIVKKLLNNVTKPNSLEKFMPNIDVDCCVVNLLNVLHSMKDEDIDNNDLSQELNNELETLFNDCLLAKEPLPEAVLPLIKKSVSMTIHQLNTVKQTHASKLTQGRNK